MKYVFMLMLLLVGGGAALMGGAIGWRFVHNMTESPRIVPGGALVPSSETETRHHYTVIDSKKSRA